MWNDLIGKKKEIVEMQPNMKNNQMSEAEVAELLDRMDMGAISTIGEDGFPYAVPVNYVIIDGKVYIHGRKLGEKVDNIKRNPKVCFTVWQRKGYEDCGVPACDTTTVYECVVIRGNVIFIDDVDTKAKVLQAIADKLVPDKKDMDMKKVPPTLIYMIEPVSMTGKYHRPAAGNNVRVREC